MFEVFEVKTEFSGQRLDKYLSEVTGFTRSKIQKSIANGEVSVNDVNKNSHYKINEGDRIKYEPQLSVKYTDPKAELEISILYEDENILVVDKSPGIVVHPAPGNETGTLLDELSKRYDNPELVHRLDKDTSGLLVVALDEKSALDLRKQFKDRIVKKIYITIVKGCMKEEAGEISAPIRRSRRDPTKMSVGWSASRPSTTRYKVLKNLNQASLVEVYLLTGRTHQIRVHFSYEGYPVLGDSKYGEVSDIAGRQMLHAWKISFEHPCNGKRLSFESVIPKDFEEVLEKLS